MRIGNFSVLVPEGRELESGHVDLRHGTQYTLRIGNHCYDRRCDAQITIDGKDMGAYRINAGNTITLERSSHDQGRFTFFEATSSEASSAGVVSVANQDRGLLRVVFRIERKRERVVKTHGLTPRSAGGMHETRGMSNDASPGITGLTGHSNQSFYEVPNLDYDPTEETVINLRLVADRAVRKLCPNVQKSNPVPESVG